MMILDLGVFSYLDLEVHGRFWLYLPKVGNLKVWKVHRLDRELTFRLLGFNYGFGTWSRLI